MAFLSGLFFTINNFIIKGTRVDYGEVLAIRSIIQIPLMSCIVFIQGRFKKDVLIKKDMQYLFIFSFYTITLIVHKKCFPYRLQILANYEQGENNDLFGGRIWRPHYVHFVCMRKVHACRRCDYIDIYKSPFYHDFCSNIHAAENYNT